MLESGHHVTSLKRPSWNIPQNVDVIIHCAAYVPPSYDDTSSLTVEKCMIDNAVSTLRLLQSAEKQGVKKFIYLSSGQIYKWTEDNNNAHDLRVREGDAIDPIMRASPYLISKMAGDCLVRGHGGQIQKVILRPASVYGPEMKPVGVIHRLLKKIKNKEKIDLNNEDYRIDLVHVDDVVTMIKNCVERGGGEVYNVGGDNPIQIHLLAKMLGEILTINPDLIEKNKNIPLGHTALNVDLAKQDYHYSPIRLKIGLKSYVESL